MLLERLSNSRSINHIFLDLVILRDQLRHQLQNSIEQVPRNRNYAFERIAEDNVALRTELVDLVVFLHFTVHGWVLQQTTNKGKTYRRDNDSSERHGDVARSRLCSRAGTNGGCCAGVDLRLRYVSR